MSPATRRSRAVVPAVLPAAVLVALAVVTVNAAPATAHEERPAMSLALGRRRRRVA